MVEVANISLRSARDGSFSSTSLHLASEDVTPAPRKMTGLFSQLTPEQREFAMNYKGPTNHGDPAFLLKNTRAGSR